jgi:hypothetical protein
MDEVDITKKIAKYGDDEIGDFSKAKTIDDAMDVIITFGYFPVSLYPPGNGKADGSVGEKFLEAGNMFINTADYIFYVTLGGGANGDTGLKNMTDSTFDLWTDGNSNKPSADGEKYTPSLKAFSAPRSFQLAQIEADDEWELEVAFGIDGGETRADPAVIRNTEYGGRVCIALQVSDNSQPKGEVIAEILNNWLSEVVGAESVEPEDKLSITWGELKSF